MEYNINSIHFVHNSLREYHTIIQVVLLYIIKNKIYNLEKLVTLIGNDCFGYLVKDVFVHARNTRITFTFSKKENIVFESQENNGNLSIFLQNEIESIDTTNPRDTVNDTQNAVSDTQNTVIDDNTQYAVNDDAETVNAVNDDAETVNAVNDDAETVNAVSDDAETVKRSQ